MFRLISRLVFWLQGWKVDDVLLKQKNFDKFILLGAPHTSNWDAAMFIAAMYHMKLDVKFLMKNDWLKFPFSLAFNPLGALGIDRSTSNSMVDIMANEFDKKDKLIISISPEGTRGPNEKWKRGFYYTSIKANVPILLGYLDYGNRVAGIGKEVIPTGNIEPDFRMISDYYQQFKGKVPENHLPYNRVD
jgi:1-acyl-sn-glycerol-3-phosphate acyltransferase